MMTRMNLRARIERRQARLAVIGVGYVGLPVATLFAEKGFHVMGVDVKAEMVEALNAGRCILGGEEPGLAEMLATVVAQGRFHATTEYADVRSADVAIIAVETPVDESNKPGYVALKAACRSLGPVMQPGMLVIVESTIAPGTMQGLVQPLLEQTSGMRAGEEFHLVACPERVMPGRLLRNLATMNRVVGGTTVEAAELAVALYRHIVGADLDITDALTAEVVKTAENAYRDVQIAFANEVALLCEDMGADVWRVRELVNKSPQRQMHLPGAGVGGHCIPKDPWLLIANAGKDFQARLIPAARAVNDSMPQHMAELVGKALEAEGRQLRGAVIAVLGYAYLENSDDTRNSPSARLVEILQAAGAEVRIHDPYVEGYQGEVEVLARGSDALVIMVAHPHYRALDLEKLHGLVRLPILVDGRNVISRPLAQKTGWRLFTVGVGG
jgi:UDP-N-acetyl-D-mannosaminuronic acid dehydrogenase